MEQGLKDKIALVTGAGKGIGRATAEALAKAGATLVLVARSTDDLAATEAAIAATGGKSLAVAGDLTDDAFVDRLFATVAERYGRLDILVNNAGTAPFGPVEEADAARLRACLELNVVAMFQCIQRAIRLMKANGGRGKIVNVGSVRARWTENGDCGFYNASKYAVYGLTESIARQLHGQGLQIAVGMVNPGIVDTPLTNPKGEPRPTWLRPADVAAAILHAVTAPPGVNAFETVLFSTEQKPW